MGNIIWSLLILIKPWSYNWLVTCRYHHGSTQDFIIFKFMWFEILLLPLEIQLEESFVNSLQNGQKKMYYNLFCPPHPAHSITFYFFTFFNPPNHSISFQFFQLSKFLYNIFKSQSFIPPQNSQNQTIQHIFFLKPFQTIFKPFCPFQIMKWDGQNGLPKQIYFSFWMMLLFIQLFIRMLLLL